MTRGLPSPPGADTPPTILVVDDNPATRYATARAMRAAGYAVVEGATGADALARAAAGVDLAVLDVHLPDADGRDVCRVLRERPGTVRLPVVHLSAVFVADPDKVLGLDAGADAYLTHPVDPAVLVATVRTLLRARRAEERAARVRDDFLAAVSHELRTPIAVILIWGRALRQALAAGGTPDPDAVRDALDAIEHGARVQQRLVEDLLDTTRAASGTFRLDRRDADLAAVVRAAVDAARPAAAEKGVGLDTHGVRDGDAGRVRVDAGRVEQVVWNLVNNAVKFTPPGGRVTVALRRGTDAAEIRVADTGRGIPPDFLPRVFDRFSRAETGIAAGTGGLGLGLGLGLTIARHIVELHGGTIRAESAGEGRGATFTVELPLA